MFSTHTKTGRNNMVGYTVAKIRKQQLIISQRELADRLKAIPHKDCACIAQSDFSSDCTMRT